MSEASSFSGTVKIRQLEIPLVALGHTQMSGEISAFITATTIVNSSNHITHLVTQ